MEEIIPLDKAQYAGHEIFFAYETELHYDVRVYDTAKGFSVDFVKMPLPEAVIKRFSALLNTPLLPDNTIRPLSLNAYWTLVTA